MSGTSANFNLPSMAGIQHCQDHPTTFATLTGSVAGFVAGSIAGRIAGRSGTAACLSSRCSGSALLAARTVLIRFMHVNHRKDHHISCSQLKPY
jgi:hypothetical protein